jgi:hypothetical protein
MGRAFSKEPMDYLVVIATTVLVAIVARSIQQALAEK